MNVVFRNRLEKQSGEGRVRQAHVTIAEQKGAWLVLWQEESDQAQQGHEAWYEGGDWDEMQTVFRKGLQHKMAGGFIPLIREYSPADAMSATRSRWTQMLHYYSELNRDEAVYESLRAWRRLQAARESRAPYVIATNRLLDMIGAFRPQTMEELQAIPGMGKAKAEQYGEALLELTADLKRENGFPLDWVATRIDPDLFEQWQWKQLERKNRQTEEKRARQLELLEGLALGETMAELEQRLEAPKREVLLWLEELSKQGNGLQPFLEHELKALSAEQREQAIQAFHKLGDRFLKPVLLAVQAEAEWKPLQPDEAYAYLRLLRLQLRQLQDKEQPGAEQDSTDAA
ncbi:HRDC domain-containing protein [Paenibacillus sp. y28]|uniref:HRDC domain-containing protein n=1 Tax=Paenibacillus sp. y28 TaxID=3129110 RepID=UPI00301A00BA